MYLKLAYKEGKELVQTQGHGRTMVNEPHHCSCCRIQTLVLLNGGPSEAVLGEAKALSSARF